MTHIRVGLAQVSPTPDLSQNLSTALEFMKRAASKEVEILCFPEAHLAGYRAGILDPEAPCDSSLLAEALEQVAASCRELSLAVVLGTETPNPAGKPFNSAVVIDDRGGDDRTTSQVTSDAQRVAGLLTGPRADDVHF